VSGSRTRRWRESVDAYEVGLECERISVRHRRERVRIARTVGRLLDSAGLACDPRFFDERHLTYLLEHPWRELGGGKPYNVCLLGLFLKSHGNLTVERARLRFDRTPVRPKRTLTRAERIGVLNAARRVGIVPYGMIVLMLTMGLRPSEVRRLTVDGALSEPVIFVGKKRGIEQGLGKVRRVPAHPLFRELLPELLAHRAQVVSGVASRDPGLLFCHVKNGAIVGWGKAWMERHFVAPVLDSACVHTRFNLSYQLRRTFGRVAHLEQGHSLPRVARLMGHADQRTTAGYLGLTDDDDREVMDTLRESFGSPLAPLAERRKGGRIGHAG
jgi:integrase